MKIFRHAVRALLLTSLAFAAWGCAMRPDSAPWSDGQSTIVAQPPLPYGQLTVETPDAGSVGEVRPSES